MRRLAMLVCAAAVALPAFVARPAPAVAQKRQRVELPAGSVLAPGARPVLSLDGSVGFVAPAAGATVVAFAVRTGEVLAALDGLGNASGIAVNEDGSRRLLAVTIPGDLLEARRAAVVVIDATEPASPRVLSTFALPESARLAPGARAEIMRGQRIGVVAIVAPVAAILSFDVRTGEQVGALTLDGAPDQMALFERGEEARIGAVSATSNKIAILSVSEHGVLLPVSSFEPPAGSPLSPVNNLVFSGTGGVAFVASLEGRELLSFATETGELVDRLPTEGSSAAVAVYHEASRDVVAVVNISRPGGATAAAVEASAEAPLGVPGALVASAGAEGRLAELSRFYPETGEEAAPANNPDFSADGRSLFVPVRTGALYVVDAATGKARSREGLDSHVQSIASAPLAEAVAVVTAGGSAGAVEIVPVAPSLDPSAERPETPEGAPEAREPGGRKQGVPAIARLKNMTVQSGRRRDLPVTIVGTGFAPGAVVVAAGETYTAAVGPNARRVQFTLPASALAVPGSVSIQVRNPDGALSNAVALTVVAPFAPVVAKVSPGTIKSGSGGVDLQIRGDHFRNGAVARVTYTDRAGAAQTAELTTYRLSFTRVVARLPRRLTERAEELSLVVVDRDGSSASEPSDLRVVGPSVTSVLPERAVAGDVGAGETLNLKITGDNIHPDAIVYVKRPARGAGGEPQEFRQVPAANVRRKSETSLVVRLTAQDTAYSGALVVRVVNPVPGERRKNGDAADYSFTVAGPVITAASPEVILAGTDAFFLKLDGTDFRSGAVVKLVRTDGGGSVDKRVVEDPKFKDGERINVPMDTEELLRLVARPGTLSVRVINPSLGRGDPSPARDVEIVGPSVVDYELVPSESDPTEYRLTLNGIHFREGALVRLFTAGGEPVGGPKEAKVKSDMVVVVRVGRGRVTDLGTFKAVVINPGGPYNPDGVPSNAIDVTVR